MHVAEQPELFTAFLQTSVFLKGESQYTFVIYMKISEIVHAHTLYQIVQVSVF